MRPPARRRGTVFVVSVAVAACVAAALVHVYVHLQVIQAGYELGRESRIRHDLHEANQKLHLELAVRTDPSVIERRARDELKMAPPDPALLRVIGPDGRVETSQLPPSTSTSPDRPAVAARGGGAE